MRSTRRGRRSTPDGRPGGGPGSCPALWSSAHMSHGGATPAAMKWWGWGHEASAFTHEDKPELAPFIGEAIGVDVRRPGRAVRLRGARGPGGPLPAGAAGRARGGGRREHVSTDALGPRRPRVRQEPARPGPAAPRRPAAIPDVVVHPGDEDEVQPIVAAAVAADAVIIPFGGGSNISGSLEAPAEETRPVISLDMGRMNQVLDGRRGVAAGPDPGRRARPATSRSSSTLAAGRFGHFPDSFTHSTLGGWIATRSSGMQSDKYGDIADITRGLRVVTPSGMLVAAAGAEHVDRAERARDDARQRGAARRHHRGDRACAPDPDRAADPRLSLPDLGGRTGRDAGDRRQRRARRR